MLKLLKFTILLAVIFIQITSLQCNCGKQQDNEVVWKDQVNKTFRELHASFIKVIEKASKRIQQLKETCNKDDKPKKKPLYRDCAEVFKKGKTKSGVYKIQPTFWKSPINVYCDMTTDGGGWTVFQRRVNIEPRENFFRKWDDYKKGFGKLDKEFWLGNDFIFALSNQENMTLRVDLKDNDNKKAFALYKHFLIRPESYNYRLELGAYCEGNAGDGLTETANGMAFSTKDRKNDMTAPGNDCAKRYSGAWWFNKCHNAHLNGLPHTGKPSSFGDGINWDPYKGSYYSLQFSEMKLRPAKFKKLKCMEQQCE